MLVNKKIAMFMSNNIIVFKGIAFNSIALYLVTLICVSVVFIPYEMKWNWILFGLVSVFGFFCGSFITLKKWQLLEFKRFRRNLFCTALIIRLVYVFVSYAIYIGMSGSPLGESAIDTIFYDSLGKFGADLITEGNFSFVSEFSNKYGVGVSDTGYGVYLSFLYYLTSDSILFVRLLKAVLGAWSCVLIYQLSSRNFGEYIGKIAAIFCMLMPNLIYYCGLHLKEIEMVFLVVLFAERADLLLRKSKIDIKLLLISFFIGLLLFTFRTVLGAVIFMALFTSITMTTNKIIDSGRKIIFGFLFVFFVSFAIGGRVTQEVETLLEAGATNQENSMKFRSERKGGNSFAAYASAAVFAPMIFTIPFPTMIETPNQDNQRWIHGGNFVKNITSFFTIIALFTLLISGKWRKHILLIALPLGYLFVIAFSGFAHSERFHLPALPFSLIFAAYGVCVLKSKHKKLFVVWMIFLFFSIIAWSWFKLAGRGLL